MAGRTTDDTLISGGLLLIAIAIIVKIIFAIAEIINWFAGGMLVVGIVMFFAGLTWRAVR